MIKNLTDTERLRRSIQIRNTTRPPTPEPLVAAVQDILRTERDISVYTTISRKLYDAGFKTKNGNPLSISHIRYIIDNLTGEQK